MAHSIQVHHTSLMQSVGLFFAHLYGKIRYKLEVQYAGAIFPAVFHDGCDH